VHEYVGLIEIMPQTLYTVHGVGAITKPDCIIFAAFNVSVTLNLVQRSIKVIHFRKPVYKFI